MLGSTPDSIENIDMDSTPAPIPISICLLLMEFAMFITAWRPDEHYLLIAETLAVSGSPAKNMAILAVWAPAPGCKTLPMQTS